MAERREYHYLPQKVHTAVNVGTPAPVGHLGAARRGWGGGGAVCTLNVPYT